MTKSLVQGHSDPKKNQVAVETMKKRDKVEDECRREAKVEAEVKCETHPYTKNTNIGGTLWAWERRWRPQTYSYKRLSSPLSSEKIS